jgi:hypothetical protein
MAQVTCAVSFSNASLKYHTDTDQVTVGSSADIQVAFSFVLSVTGTPLLTLSNGDTATYYGLSSTVGSGASAFNAAFFSYVPTATPLPASADALIVTGLNLNGGTITDGSGSALGLVSFVGRGAVPQTLPELVIPEVDSVTQSASSGILTISQSETISIGFNAAVNVSGADKPWARFSLTGEGHGLTLR